MPRGKSLLLVMFGCELSNIHQDIWPITGVRKGMFCFVWRGELRTELEDGRTFDLKPGMSYQVADHAEAHRSSTVTGAKLFIVD